MSDLASAQEEHTRTPPSSPGLNENSLCQPCQRKGKRHEPVGYCKDCMKYLCEACHSSHLNTKQRKHHVLFDWKSPSKSFRIPKIKMSKSVEDICTTRCTNHADKVVEYFCSVHDFLGCSVCMARDHTGCEGVKYIPELSTALDDNDEYKSCLKDLVSIIQKSQATIRDLKEEKTKAELHGANIIHQLRKHRRQITETLDDIENELMLQIDTAKAKDIDKIDSCMSKYESACREVERQMSGLQNLHQTKHKCQLFIKMKTTKASLKPVENMLSGREDIPSMQYSFHANCEASELIKDVSILGNIGEAVSDGDIHPSSIVREKVLEFEKKSREIDRVSPVPTEPVSATGYDKPVMTTSLDEPDYVDDYFNAETSHTNNGDSADPVMNGVIRQTEIQRTPSQTPDDLIVNHIKNIYVKSNTDFYPVSITGSVLLSDNKLLIIDTANWKLKLVDTQQNVVVQEVRELGCPWDITNIDENEVAITMPMLKKIVVFKYGHIFPSSSDSDVTHVGFTRERDINTRGHCYGIAHTHDKLIVSFSPDLLLKQGSTKIEILNMQGHVLKRIMGEENGDTLFLNPKYVGVMEDAKTIFVSDWGDDSVTSITPDGDVLATYEDVDLQRPGKLSIDSHDTVFVCGSKSIVHRITAECVKLQATELNGNGQSIPRTISMSEKLGLLYTGMVGSDFIRVYHTHCEV